MNIKNRAITLSSIGFALGVVICQIVSASIATVWIGDGTLHLCVPGFVEFVGSELWAFIIQSLLCGLYGSICFGGSAVYYLENWSMLRALVTHFLMTVISYYLMGFFLRWFSPDDISWCLLWFGIFILVYLSIWLSHILIYRAQMKEINEELVELRTMLG